MVSSKARLDVLGENCFRDLWFLLDVQSARTGPCGESYVGGSFSDLKAACALFGLELWARTPEALLINGED